MRYLRWFLLATPILSAMTLAGCQKDIHEAKAPAPASVHGQSA